MFIEGIRSALSRLDYLITFSLVMFVKAVIDRYLTTRDLLYISLVGLMSTRWPGPPKASPTIISTMHHFFAVLLVDVLMSNLRQPTAHDTNAFWVVTGWLSATAAVIIVPTIASQIHHSETMSQLTRIVLFSYAENTSLITQDIEINHVLPAVAIVVVHYLRRMLGKGTLGHTTANIAQAASMVLTNAVITSIINTDDLASDGGVQIAWLLAFIIVIDHVDSQLGEFGDIRDYAVWKSSDSIVNHLQVREVDTTTIAGASVIVCFGAIMIKDRLDARMKRVGKSGLVDVSVLVFVNAILNGIKKDMMGIPSRMVWVILLSVLCVLHTLMPTG